MTRYHDPKTGKTVDAKEKSDKEMKVEVKKFIKKKKKEEVKDEL
jgi:hypothetical protein